MTNFQRCTLLMATLSVWLVACGRAEFEPAAPATADVQVSGGANVGDVGGRFAAEPAPPPPPGVAPEASIDGVSDPALQDAEQPNRAEKLIYRAELRVALVDPDAAAKALLGWVKANGGYLLEQRGNRLVVRIPSANFHKAVEQVVSKGELIERQVHVDDVTEQYFDLEARIRNAEALRQRLVALMERATKVEDALRIEQELGRVSEQLEVLQGKLRRLRELVAYSTVGVEWVQVEHESLEALPALPFEWLGTLGLSYLLQSKDQ